MDPVPPRIDPMAFPELALLVWNRDPGRPLLPEEAFALYERNWRLVDPTRLVAREAALIEALIARFGRGFLLG